MADVNVLTDDNFDTEVLQSSQPVFVDFWGPGCPPCKAIAPMIAELAAENADAVKFAKVNVYEAPKTAGAFGIQNIPTLILFNSGEEVERIIGMKPKSRLQEVIDQVKA